ncbi:heme-binding protein [Aquamicrobium sp. LC103]|uniref:GlcG/HbpS family heme-binding protein n=1 Tax=Aquamicrobium sp. LC103 TaxID=1120658 RepID=UPI00063EB1D5|nr:heme-binding protein [Aquamicrobium sp. LC103]TKT69211.1 heme-binding protein [Aquamicrobium sp. LC103]
MTALTLSLADRIADATLEAGRKRNASPLTVAVLDAGGHVVVMKRADNSGILRCEIAHGKAWGALGMGLPTRTLSERAKNAPAFFAAIAAASEGRLIPVPGGILLRNDSGGIIGAVGVSGDTSDMDEDCAMEAIAACGCIGDNGLS